MGGSSKQTVGYRYYMGLHMILCAGPVDAFTKITSGGREAWSGSVTASGSIPVNAPELFGGEEREGGVYGALDVMMGESTQIANTYLAAKQSGPQPAYRGLLGVVFRQGLIGCNNPYIKPWAFKVTRILKGWQGGTPWYSAKASINMATTSGTVTLSKALVAGMASGAVLTIGSTTAYLAAEASSGDVTIALHSTAGISNGASVDDPGGSAVQSGTVVSAVSSPTIAAMNPAHIVYECLTNQEWGAGNGTSLIDDASFRAAADVMHAEGMGLCMQWMRQQPIEDFIQIVCDHAGMNLGQDRRTGLFVLRMLRGGYDASTLPVYDESSILAVENYQRPAIPEQVNELVVKYDDIATGADGSVTVQNLANITSQGGVVTQSKNYPGLPTASLAIRVALRDLRVVSSPLAKVRLRANRKAYNLLPGDLIRLNWGKLGLTGLVLRVLQVNVGTLTDGAIQIDCAEDVFSLPATGYAAQQPTGWAPPNNKPAVATNRIVEEASYYEIVRELGTDAATAMPEDAGYLVAAASRPSGDAIDFGMRTSSGSGAYQELVRDSFCPTGVLTAALAPGATTATLTGLVDADLVTTGGFAQIGTELVRVDAFSATTGAITLGRGIMGTVAKAHAAGARLYFRDGYTAADPTERVEGETVSVKLITTTGLGALSESAAPVNTVTLNQRAARPYPPGRLRIASQIYPSELINTSPVVSWAHRSRLQQNLEGDETSNIGPEAGTVYAVEYRNADTGDVIHAGGGLSGTAYTPPDMIGIFNLGIRVWSIRGGLESFQQHDHTLLFSRSSPAVAIGALLFARCSLTTPLFDIGPGTERQKGIKKLFGKAEGNAGTLGSAVVLLMHADGADGSTTLVDSGPRGQTLTASGTAQISTAQSRFGGSSLTMSGGVGNGGVLVGTSGALPPGWEAFQATNTGTFEGWAYVSSAETAPFCIILSANQADLSPQYWPRFQIGVNTASMSICVWVMGNNIYPPMMVRERYPARDQWFHWAVVFDAGRMRIFLNGQSMIYRLDGPYSYDWIWANPLLGPNCTVTVGEMVTAGNYIDELRVSTEALYKGSYSPVFTSGVSDGNNFTADFEPPSFPFPSA